MPSNADLLQEINKLNAKLDRLLEFVPSIEQRIGSPAGMSPLDEASLNDVARDFRQRGAGALIDFNKARKRGKKK